VGNLFTWQSRKPVLIMSIMSTLPDQKTHSQHHKAALLALIAGYVDAYTLLNFKVYASFMSGNTTQTGVAAGNWLPLDVLHHFLPIPLFVLGIFLGTFLLQGGVHHPLRNLCLLVAALLVAGLAATWLGSLAMWCSIILLSFAMGVLNTTITHVGGQSVSLGFVTGDLNNFGIHLAMTARGVPLADPRGAWDTHLSRAAILAVVWGAFLIGAALSTAGMHFLGYWILLPPAFVLFLLAWSDSGSPAR
jgi:uncharacterized membrane protein YoaK (UPF0700 family)